MLEHPQVSCAKEALTLKREDIAMKGDIPRLIISGETIGTKKSPGEVYVFKGILAGPPPKATFTPQE